MQQYYFYKQFLDFYDNELDQTCQHNFKIKIFMMLFKAHLIDWYKLVDHEHDNMTIRRNDHKHNSYPRPKSKTS